MATVTLDKQTEVVEVKGSVSDAAGAESRAGVSGSARRGESRAWNAKAQID